MTYIGELPGQYYDKEKDKYFTIQKNHHVAAGSKHAESNVIREKRQRKKQKCHDYFQAFKNTQTIRRSHTLENPAMRFGLRRELGIHSPVVNRQAGDDFVLNRMAPQTITFKIKNAPRPQIVDAQSIKEDKLNVVVCGFSPKSYCIYVQPTPAANDEQSSKSKSWRFSERMSPNMAFNNIVVSLSLGPIDQNSGVQRYLACTRGAGSQGHLYLGQFDRDTSTTSSAGTFISLFHHQTVWSSTYEPINNRYAVSSSDAIYLVEDDRLGSLKLCGETNWDNEGYRGVTWLDPKTIAFSTRPDPNETTDLGEIALWDVRSKGNAVRFRRKQPFTGLHCLDNDGVHLIAPTNRAIHLFDTRMDKKPLLTFSHVHQGPELQFTADKPGIVAAFDRDNEFRTYSLRTGKHLGTLTYPTDSTSLITQPRYYEHSEAGPFFQACQDNNVVRWKWVNQEEA